MAKKKRRKKAKRRTATRVQVARICSPALSQLLVQPGESANALKITLGEAVKRLWAYAKARRLNEGKEIRCNDAMHRLFGVSKLGMFQVAGKLSEHISGAGPSAPRPPAPAVPTVPNPPLKLSPELTALLSGARSPALVLTRTDALRRVGDYIKRCGLRDQSDKRKIHCDAALAAIVGQPSFTIFEAKALLERHFSAVGGVGQVAAAAVASEEEDDDDDEDDDEDEEEEEEEDNDAPLSSSEWQCRACTLLNSVKLIACDACGTPRDGAAAATTGAETDSTGAPPAVNAAATAAQAAADATAVDGAGERRAPKRKRVPPQEFMCPITQEVMSDPVSTVDGQTYERSAIARWLARKKTSPLTGMALETTALIPNHALRKLIEESWRP